MTDLAEYLHPPRRDRDTFTRLAHAEQSLDVARLGLGLMQPRHLRFVDAGLAAEVDSGEMPAGVREAVHRLRIEQISGFRICLTFAVATTLGLQTLRGTEPEFDTWWEAHRRQMRSDPLSTRLWNMRTTVAHEGYVDFFEYRFKFDTNSKGLEGEGHLIVCDAPSDFRQEPIWTDEAHALATMYVEWIDEILGEAWERFAPGVERTDIVPSALESGPLPTRS